MSKRDERAQMLETLHEMLDYLAPLREAMQGFRTSLTADGWSETMAEQIAATFFQETLRKILRT